MSLRKSLRRVSGILILLGIGVALALPAFASTLNGTLTVAPELGRRFDELETERAGKLKQYYWRVPNGAISTTDPRVDPAKHLAVILEAEGSSGAAPAGQPRVVHLQGGELAPAVVTITPHTKVRFRNTDAFVYELECPENNHMANARALPPGQQVDYPFDAPGVFMITDRRLPHLVGWVVVVNTPRTTMPQAGSKANQASFTFEDVGPGSYKVKVFFAGEWIAEQGVQVPEDQDEVGVQISLPADGEQHEQGEGQGEGEAADAEAGQ